MAVAVETDEGTYERVFTSAEIDNMSDFIVNVKLSDYAQIEEIRFYRQLKTVAVDKKWFDEYYKSLNLNIPMSNEQLARIMIDHKNYMSENPEYNVNFKNDNKHWVLHKRQEQC